ncbi:MAG: hypothetical protein V4565_09515 [Bacteroidota bacterium]
MKNLNSNNTQYNLKNSNSNILALCLIFILATKTIYSQSINQGYHLGAGVGTHLSGNSHGAIYDLSLSLYDGKNHFSIGPSIQKRKEKVCGGTLRYTRILTGQENFSSNEAVLDPTNDCQRIQLFSFVNAQYLKGAGLSYKAIKLEEAASKQNDFQTDYSKYELSTVELFVGFGINTKINKKLVWSSSIGFGTYYHLNYINGLYNERMAPVLMLGTALRLNYFKR